ncbi:right-handed parallel beta-helix repeat-containing protein [Hyunsoonleella pacifica]|uniref:Right handed beta helix domain-containing protein n=1 Tax=Hyunsoonleella pacifica TaxID=1080224 RepID=A0A4Q9FNP8_9FLAO|nr:hypothetical protein [Hyunsoonleella pacifica]TBN16315.1 hypothetical protein EYD46_06615 [Hyunsoonleella pacifica]GGD20503.1 hypothetical protein GCM10011368_23040 [Hyunsoonleella pacifica]
MKTKITILAIALLLSFMSGAQNIITVDNSVGANAQYSDLQSAIDAAANGDILYVHASTDSYGNVNISKTLTLIGFGHSAIDKNTFIEDIILLNGSSNSRFTGLNFNDFYPSSAVNETINNIVIENCLGDQIYFRGATPVDNIIIQGSVIRIIGNSSSSFNNYTNAIISNNIIGSIVYIDDPLSISIKNNVFLTPSTSTPISNEIPALGNITVQNNILYYNTSSTPNPNANGVIFENCLAYNVGSGTVSVLSGNNNLNNQNPQFVNITDTTNYNSTDDYNLQAGSPAIDSGVQGVDMGIYDGSTFTFNSFGFTNGIPTVKITNITDRIAPEDNLSVTIDTNAN